MNLTIIKDESKVSNKSLSSNKFYSETGFQKPNWFELIDQLYVDYNMNMKIYK